MASSNKIPEIDKELTKSPNHFPVVGIGASAGGLDAFKKLLRAIPEDSGMAYVLVQHLDPNHESLLVELLQKVTAIPVLEIADDIKVQPNHIYILPSNKMMIANDGVLELSPRPTKNKMERNLPIDLFFTSLAEVHQSHAIGVVLSGTASDGTMGLKAIKDHGGITFAQDEESAQFEGMPQSAVEAGVVDFILPPDKIPQKLLEVINIIRGKDVEDMPQQDEDVFKQILSLLRIRKGTDFTYYKQATIRRRILRRMAINKTEELSVYLKYLREKKTEQDLLYQDLLIPVTEFFRDPKIFDSLRKTIFPLIVKNKKEGEPIRVWVAGCSTGEEVYSIAICFKELLGDRFSPDGHQRVQIFATDISEPAIAKARSGIYSKSNVQGLSEEHIKEYFTKNNGDYQVKKSIRDLCVFAQHNFLKDPAFSKMDFISCRNVLIYMEPYLQKRALTTFHYALNPKGFLLLGKSETTNGVPEHFALCQLKGTAKTDKIFTRKDIASRFMPTVNLRSEKSYVDTIIKSKNEVIQTDFQKTADDIMLSKYTPAGVVVNEAMDIVHFRGSTGNFLEPSPGKASFNLLKMAKEGLAFELRNILHKAKKENATVVKENIPILINGVQRNISIEAMPLPNTIEPHYLVLFHNQSLNANSQLQTGTKKSTASSKSTSADKDLRILQLEKELSQSREDMRSITEDQEAANEELQSANEELLSGSEELQSLNEEMETSKEELQSTNEELTVVNQEMIGLNEQVTEARDYAEAIISTLHEPLLVLDKHFRIKSANYSFYKIFQVSEKDTEGKSIFDLGNKQWNIPELRELLQNILSHRTKFENFEVAHNFPNIGERIVLLNARELINQTGNEKLILLAIADITEQKKGRKKIEESEQRFRNLVEQSMYPILVLKGEEMILDVANSPLLKIWNVGKEALGKPFLEILPEMKGQPFMDLLLNVLHNHVTHYGKEQPAHFNRVNGEKETVYFNFVYQPYTEKDGTVSGVIVFANDVTEQVLAHKKVEESEFRYHNMITTSTSAIGILNGEDMVITTANDAIFEIWGKGKDLTGKKYFEVLPELAEQGYKEVFAEVYKTGKPFVAVETPVSILQNGEMTLKYYNFILQPQYSIEMEIIGVGIIATEVTSQAEQNLKIKESEARFRSLADNIPLNVFITDPTAEANISYFNKYWLDYTGQTAEEALGRAWDGIVHSDDVQTIMDVYVPAFEARQPYYLPNIRIKRYDGQYRWFAVQGNPRYLPNGEFMGFIGVGFDVHEQKLGEDALKQSEAHFRLLADLMPAKISNASADGGVTYSNKHWLDFSGYSFEDLRDFGYHQIMHPDELEEFQTRLQHAASTLTDLVMEMRFKNKAGDYIWHLNIASPIKDENGHLKMWIGVTTDISEQIKTRETNLVIYEKHANELKHAKELAELAAEQAENAAKSKQQFLSNMSHEIRTPLNSILGFTNVLLKTELSEKQKEFVQAIKTSSTSLNVLINDILDLAKVDAGKMTFVKQPFDMHKSIRSILHSFDLKIEEKNLELVKEYDSDIPALLLGDSVRLNQIILNLMSNAVKFTHKGKITLSVKIQSEAEENIYIEFVLTDTGIGIADDKIGSIFNLFEQAGINTSTSYGGTGLGLAIVKQLVEFQGGSISASSKIGEGSTFSFILPFGKTTVQIVEEVEIIKLDSTIKNLRVLVAEDVVLNQLLIKIILSDFGFEHDVVNNGKMAIEQLQNHTYDIILMDIQMPEMDGFQATEYIRKTMKSNIPIIALTADVTTVDVAKCKEFGMDAYISKPIDENELYNKIVALVNK